MRRLSVVLLVLLVSCGTAGKPQPVKIVLDEDYFIGLLGYTDIGNSVSYSDFITSRQLAL